MILVLLKACKCCYLHIALLWDKLSDFPDGTGNSHRAPVIKAMWPGATIIWTAWIKQLRKWHILTILTIIWYTNQSKPHTLWGNVTDVSCLAVHVQSIWSAFSIVWVETFWQIKIKLKACNNLNLTRYV